jgi:hypothetical protein
MPEPNRWYVSYTVKSDQSPRRYARRTKTFETEESAKLFVREITVDRRGFTAGTINPHLPKRIVSPDEIATWLEAPIQIPNSCRASERARPEKGAP